MAVVRCPRGHYYEDSRFSFCPHCGITVGSVDEPGADSRNPDRRGEGSAKEKPKAKKKGFLGWLDNELTAAKPRPEAAASPDDTKQTGESVTVAMKPVEDGACADDGQKTVGLYSPAAGNDYVTGWLVCVRGAETGRDYRLHHGFNQIGRSFDMDVQVADDEAVSRKNHCAIVYDDKSRQFFAVPGADALTYYQGELLVETVTLHAGDELTLGKSSFIFVPFCGEGWSWDQK